MSSKASVMSLERWMLGTELRRLREAAGMSQEAAAATLGKTQNKISRAETGDTGVTPLELDKLLDEYGAPEKDRLWCRTLNEKARQRTRHASGETTLYGGPKWFRAFRLFEFHAIEVLQIGTELVTGALQTEAYIRALFAAQGFGPTDDRVDETVQARASRRALLSEGSRRFAFVLSEGSLRQNIGGPAVMAEQLRYLAEVALLPNIMLQVIPLETESYEPIGTKFTLFRFPPDTAPDTVYFELSDDATYLNKPETVRRCADLFGRLQGVALGQVESRNFILELADQFAARSSSRG